MRTSSILDCLFVLPYGVIKNVMLCYVVNGLMFRTDAVDAVFCVTVCGYFRP